MAEVMSREDMLAELAAAYERVIETAVEAARRGATSTGDAWGPRETVAHLAGWEVMATVRIPHIAAGMAPLEFADDARQAVMTDAINATIVAMVGEQPVHALCDLLRQAYQRDLALLRSLDDRFFQPASMCTSAREPPSSTVKSTSSCSSHLILMRRGRVSAESEERRDMTTTWLSTLKADPLPWLLEDATVAVRHLTLRQLLDQSEDAPAVRQARAAAMQTDPIASILAAEQPEGYWVKPGPGYTPKYRGTVWQLIFLDQLGADGTDARVQAACDYVLSHTQARSGGFACWGGGSREEAPPPPSLALHCLNGNLLRALIGFGRLEDERVQRAIDWQARAITGEGFTNYYRSGTSGPGFRCGSNERLPCAWGAIKGLWALARIPPDRRAPHVERAIEQGVSFLLSCDPATATYPAGWGNTQPSPLWFRLGFPLGYTADLLQNLTVLCELGYAKDRRLQPAIEWLLSKQEPSGRWRNESAYNGKTWVNIERQGQPSKWVTLRACAVLKAVYG